jgi:hypothetical protein
MKGAKPSLSRMAAQRAQRQVLVDSHQQH